MTKSSRAITKLKGKARMRSEIVEAMRGLHKIGAVGDAELETTTLRVRGDGNRLKAINPRSSKSKFRSAWK